MDRKFALLFFYLEIAFILQIALSQNPSTSGDDSDEEGMDPFGSVSQNFHTYFNLVRRQAVGRSLQLAAGPNITNIYEHLADLVGCDLRENFACSYIENRQDGSIIEVIKEQNNGQGNIRLVDREKNTLIIAQYPDSRQIKAVDSRGNQINIDEMGDGTRRVEVKDGPGGNTISQYQG